MKRLLIRTYACFLPPKAGSSHHTSTSATGRSLRPTIDIPTGHSSSPRLLWVPAPVCTPSLFCPQASAHHTKRQEGQANGHQTVCGWQERGRAPPQSGKCQQEGAAKKAVREHVYRDVWHEPCALQSRHQTLAVKTVATTTENNGSQR